jgi:transcriptional regulator with XRE-family HTH domain
MYQNTSPAEKKKLYKEAKSHLAQCVSARRKALKLSQEDLAFRIGASQGYISLIESGKLNPTLETIAELADALELEFEAFL